MKVLLMVDVPNWAWDNKAKALMKYLPQYDFTKIFLKEFQPEMIKQYDSIHSFTWSQPFALAKYMTANISSFHYNLKHRKLVKQVVPKYKGVSAVSTQLYKVLVKEKINKNIFCCPNGVDHEKFYPDPKEHEKFVVGWVGNPTTGGYNREHGKMDIKGFYLLLKPLMQRMSKYKDIEFKLHACKWRKAIDHNLMPRFFRTVDVQICTSICEGTPNPMFEAGSCGIPLISTKVGAIAECIEHGINGYIIPSYDKPEHIENRLQLFEHYILKLKKHRDLCKKMGKAIRKTIEDYWTWKERAKQWIPLFEAGKI